MDRFQDRIMDDIIVVPLTTEDGSMLDEAKLKAAFEKHKIQLAHIDIFTNIGVCDEYWTLVFLLAGDVITLRIYREASESYYNMRLDMTGVSKYTLGVLVEIINDLHDGLGLDDMYGFEQITPEGKWRSQRRIFPWERERINET